VFSLVWACDSISFSSFLCCCVSPSLS
jgi:hypothetical protein